EWIVAGIQLVLGAGHTLEASYSQATRLLSQASSGFHECGDTFGEAMSRLWQCLVWYRSGDSTRLRRDIADSLQLIQTHGYSFIFQRPVLLGPPDPRALVPLLIFARDHHSQTVYAEQMLSELGLSAVETHPGYQLRVQTLGQFRLWHGREELSGKVWKRKKARQLFQFLLTHRGQMVHRDQIIELLWPDLPPDGAVRDFKIAFSGMCNVLEPERTRNAPSAYIARDGSRYGLRPTADLWLDTAEFEATIHEGNRLYVADPQAVRPYYEQALSLYEGDFLQAYPYEVWSDEERNRLRLLFLRTAERVAQTCMAQKAWEETIAICHDILAADDCWETAYQMMMTAYHQMGNRTQALRTYQQCVTALQAGLGVEPTAVTTHLYQNLTEPA
ncbi:MAG: transcriptional regulator, partial [Chloroflexi bacterium]|nr:transcriptional regulator [Chloroflexota bacterium]